MDPFEYLKKENDEVALEFLERRENALAKYAAKIKIIDENNELTNSKEEIIRSIIHMSYNRLIGDTEWEKRYIHYQAMDYMSLYVMKEM
ncbi:MAG: lantibiotic dehydratase C-terminal domain-containing protein [Lachnospiraceae bacterium]